MVGQKPVRSRSKSARPALAFPTSTSFVAVKSPRVDAATAATSERENRWWLQMASFRGFALVRSLENQGLKPYGATTRESGMRSLVEDHRFTVACRCGPLGILRWKTRLSTRALHHHRGGEQCYLRSRTSLAPT